MKRLTVLFTLLASLFGMQMQAQNNRSEMKILVAYYSYSGNTRAVAEQIGQATGADIFMIDVKESYPSDYQALLDRAKQEIEQGVKPALKAMPKDLAQYDVIFVGSPNWWSTIAPPVATFLANGDFSGKTVIPFVTHGGGGMAKCESAVKQLCPQSRFLKGYAVNGSSVGRSKAQVERWLREIGIIQ